MWIDINWVLGAGLEIQAPKKHTLIVSIRIFPMTMLLQRIEDWRHTVLFLVQYTSQWVPQERVKAFAALPVCIVPNSVVAMTTRFCLHWNLLYTGLVWREPLNHRRREGCAVLWHLGKQRVDTAGTCVNVYVWIGLARTIYVYTVCIRYFCQGHHQMYGHIWRIYNSGQPYIWIVTVNATKAQEAECALIWISIRLVELYGTVRLRSVRYAPYLLNYGVLP